MKIADLIPAISVDCEVSGIAFDSRKVRAGDAFFAVPGVNDDGEKYANEALLRGAACVVSAKAGPGHIVVPDVRKALAQAAASYYGDPSSSLDVYAVTGTNGKTTTAGIVRDIMDAAGKTCGLLSTVEVSFMGERVDAERTTPDAVSVQRFLASVRDGGGRAVSLEASSHALSQSRLFGVRFTASGFTNLSRDHLDYHNDFESYFAAKCELFHLLEERNRDGIAVVNRDDEYGARLIRNLRKNGVPTLSYSLVGGADIVASKVNLGATGTSFLLSSPFGKAEVRTPLLGRFNVQNILCALGMCSTIPLEKSLMVLANAKPRWGRLEKVAFAGGVSYFVDYAHTPDAIEKVLTALREITKGRLIIVFGCGGDRDRIKRPQMAKIASELADICIVTSDNPRTESPSVILDEVDSGFPDKSRRYREESRRNAIAMAIKKAREDDVVVIAGKGHEAYQEIMGKKYYFSDKEEVLKLLSL